MSLSLRRTRGDAVLRAVPTVAKPDQADTDPARPEPSLRSGWESLDNDSHLVECPHCGLRNGQSATLCWGCEADLSPVVQPSQFEEDLPLAADPAPAVNESELAPAAASTPWMHADADPPLSMPASATAFDDTEAARPLALGWPPRPARKRVNRVALGNLIAADQTQIVSHRIAGRHFVTSREVDRS